VLKEFANKPYNNGANQAEKYRSDDGKIKSEVLFFYPDISGQAADPV